MTSIELPTISPQTRETWKADTLREWSDDAKVAAWRTWGRQNIAAQREATDALLTLANLGPGMSVLDVGGGGGDPSLAAAAMVGSTGRVTVTDISHGMLGIAQEFAANDGLTNLDFRLADSEQLPFPDGNFDRALMRCVVMFLPDDVKALSEMRRVLKPGGTAAFLAWGPLEQNPMFSGMFFSIARAMPLPQPPPGTPGPFKFAEPGTLSAVLEAAGFQRIREQSSVVTSYWHLTPERFVDLMIEMGGLQWLLGQLSAPQQDQVIGDAVAHYRSFFYGQSIELPLALVLASGDA